MCPVRFRELYKLSGACFRRSRMRVFPITPKSEACELKLSRFSRQNVWCRSSRHSRSGFTLMEMLLVAAILMILMTLSLPVIVRTKGRGLQLECLSQLRQAGIGFVSYAQDHGDRFPFQVPMKEGGTLELVQAASQGNDDVFYAFRHFQAISNELNEPKVFRCPVDFRTAAGTVAQLKNDNISYFLAITADPSRPESLLSGARNFVESGGQSGSIVKLTAMSSPRWTRAGHEFKGNLLFAGGHVERTGNAGLQVALRSPTGPVSLWMPTAAPAQPQPASLAGGNTTVQNSDSERGFNMFQSFFQSPSPSSSATPSSSPSSPPAVERGVSRTSGSSTLAGSIPDAEPPSPAPEKARSHPVFASIPTSVPLPGSEPATSTDLVSEPSPGILAVMIEPERCWWCWWLILGLSVLVAFILGMLVYRRRAQRERAKAWVPVWEVPQSPGRR